MKTFRFVTIRVCIYLAICAVVLPCGCGESDKQPSLSEIAPDQSVLVDYQQTPEERAAAATRLRLLGVKSADTKVLTALLKAIKGEPDAAVRIAIINAAIGIVLDKKLELPVELVEPLFDPDPQVCRLAACYASEAGSGELLYDSPPVEAMPLLLKALRHEDVTVRSGALRALSHIHADTKTVLPEIENMLRDKAYSVRNNAAVAIWSMTKEADLVIPTCVALAGSTEPLGDPDEEAMRAIIKGCLSERIETFVREEPNQVCTELIACLRSSSDDVQRGASFLLIAFLKGKDATLAVKRKAVREEIERLAADPSGQVCRCAKDILEFADRPGPMPNDDQTRSPPSADQTDG